MTALLEHFHEAVNTPGDVEKLKKYILQLAMQGKLVKQDPNDEPASVLLKKIEEVIVEKKVKRSKPLSIITEDEIPYEIPEKWVWTRLGSISNYGVNEKAEYENTNPDCWLLELEDIEKSTSKLLKKVKVGERSFKSSKNVFYKGDVLYGKLRPYLDKVIIADDNGICSTEILPIRTYFGVNPKFLMYALKRPDFLQYIDSKMYGMKMPRLGTEDGRNALIPLPPYAEQMKIVSQIEKLFEQCNRLSSNFVKRQTTSTFLNNSIFTKIQDHSNPNQLNDLRFALENMEHLCNDKESIDQLRNSVLSLAVQGKLVEEDLNVEPASVLIGRIKVEKEKLVSEKKVKKEKPLPPIAEEEIPFDLPKGWEWVRLGEVCSKITDGSHNPPPKKNQGYPMISAKNLINGSVSLHNVDRYVNKEEFERENKRTMITKGDVMLGIIGASIGKTAIYGLDEKVVAQRSIAIIDTFINNAYIKVVLESPYLQNMLYLKSSGTAQGGVYLNTLRSLIIPLPSIEEQEKIVERVTKFFDILENLEKDISRQHLVKEIMFKAFL